jgi:drug/metabolite transporter (DMT)-like permease
MLNSLLFAAVVLIWGSAWIMVKFQIGVVPPEVSVAYRMGSAAAIMFAWSLLRPKPRRLTGEDHLFMALQGALIFSTNFFLFYLAAATLTTGLIAVVFSAASVFTIGIKMLFMGYRPPLRVLAGALLGVVGIGSVFWPQVAGLTAAPGAGTGLLLSIGGTLSFSLGGIVSARNQAHGLSGQVCTAWAMAYGAVLLSLFAMAMGSGFTFDLRVSYIGSLLYLSLIGSVLGFACYFALLRRIQAERAAYATVLFPIVALFLSTLFEDYRWTLMAFGGIGLTLIGNVLVLGKPRATASPRRK